MGGIVSKGNKEDDRRPQDMSGNGIGMGGGSYDMEESDRNFRTLVYKKRRLSDTTLAKIMTDPVVSTAFRAFLHGEFGESKLQFWQEADSFRKMGQDQPLKDRQKAAQEIYDRFLVDAEKIAELELDSETVEQIKQDLGLKNGVTTQVDGAKLERSFLLAALKVFQNIKFTYLPVFMTSPHFASLRGDEGYFKDVDDAVRKTDEFLLDMKMEFILKHPLGQYHLEDYVRKHPDVLNGKGADLVFLFITVEHFCTDPKASERAQRLARVVKRFENVSGDIRSLADVIKQFHENPQRFHEPAQGLLNHVRAEIIGLFDSIEKKFKEDELFKKMCVSITTSSVADYSKVSASVQQRHKTKETIALLNTYAEARNLQATEELTLDKVLSTKTGLCYFRRFAAQNYMEDSMEFWIAVQDFKEATKELEVSDTAALRSLAKVVVEAHLLPTSPMLINVSASMLDDTLALVNNDQGISRNVFDRPETEVFTLIRNNLWKSFQATPRFAYLETRMREKETLKNTEGHVGQISS